MCLLMCEAGHQEGAQRVRETGDEVREEVEGSDHREPVGHSRDFSFLGAFVGF